MANERGKEIDKTHLSIDTAEERGFLHRDYIAHCLRWSHVIKWLNIKQRYKRARILDIGCGREVPMAKTLYSSRYIPEKYVGVDVNVLDYPAMFKTGKFPLTLFDESDFGDDKVALEVVRDFSPRPPNVIVCFEVLEHVEPAHSLRLLTQMMQALATYADDGFIPTIFISTPCWDPSVGAAANHVNEVKYQVLGSVLETMGLNIRNVYGTFASQRDIEKAIFSEYLSGDERIYEDLKAYYDSNYLATIFAPLFPEHSRNCLWELTMEPCTQRRFPELSSIPGPWSSSTKWEEWNPDETDGRYPGVSDDAGAALPGAA